MQFIQGTTILFVDGKQAGRLDRVVIDPKTNSVTHLVIHTGVLFTQDKVVPIDSVGVGEQDQPVLQFCTSQFAQMPDFGLVHYEARSEGRLLEDEKREPRLSPPVNWYPMYPGSFMGRHITYPKLRGTRVNIPTGTVAVKEGALVISADGKHLGHMERVLTNPPTDQATYFQICRGWRIKQQRLVPFDWVDHLDEDQIRLAVGARTVQDLPE